jgi:hypothetical protein
VESLKGFVRTKANWIRFEIAGGNSKIAAFAPERGEEQMIIAMGRQVD